MKKRILSTMMALALCLSLLPTAAFAGGDDNTEADMPVCTCETACTADAMNANCPVCGTEGAAAQNCGRYAAHTAEEPVTSSAPAESAVEPEADADPMSETAPAPETDPEPNVDAAVTATQALIDALPTAETVTADDYGTVQAAYDAYEALTAEQQAQITGADCCRRLFAWFNAQTTTLDETAAHTHYLCGGTTCTGTGSHTCESAVTFTKWTATDSLPDEKGNYYLDADVTLSECWAPADGTVLCLNGHTITMNAEDYVIHNDDAFTLTDCNASGKQGRITHGEDASGDTYSGSGIINTGTFTMFGGIISGNHCQDGSGVQNLCDTDDSVSFSMYGGTISSNSAPEGGGVYMYESKFNMTGGTISNNTARISSDSYPQDYGDGGGVYIESGEFNLSATGSITGNTSGQYGGGVYMYKGKFNMTGSSITGNTTYDRGGGIYAANTTMTVGGSAKITGNQEDYYSSITDDNLYLYNSQIALDADTPLTTGAAFGVSCAAGRTVVTGINGNAAYFTADNNLYELVIQGSDLVMQKRTVELIVNGVYVSGSNNDVLGDGGSVKYDQTTHTLTLTNAIITKACEYVSGYVAGICAFNDDDTLNIVLVGDNTITVPSTSTKYQSAGIDTYDAKISGSGSLTVTGTSAQTYTCGLRTRCLTIDNGVTLYAATGNTSATGNFTWNGAIYASRSLTIGKATVTGIAGAASSGKSWAYSYGIYAGELTIKNGAEVSGTGGAATAGKNGSNGGSYGIYSDTNVSIGSANITAVSGTCSAEAYGYASGLSVTGNLTISDGAEITVTGGNISATGSSTPSSTDGYARGCGIYVGKNLTVGKAKITAASGTLSGRTGGYSNGIYVYNSAVIGDGADVTATSGSVTSTGINSEAYGTAGCYALDVYESLTIGKATVKAVAGDALVLNTGLLMDTSSEYPYNYYYSYARSYAVYVGAALETAAGSKVTAIAGTATCLDLNDSTKSGQYLNAYSYGVYLVDGSTLSGTLIATGGNVCGHYGTYVYDDKAGQSVAKTPGGYAGSFGIAVDDGDLTIKRGANVKATSAHAETNGTEVGYVYSQGLYVYGGDLTMDGGALSMSAGTVKNGAGNDSTGLMIGTNETDGNTSPGGQLIVRGGWLKAEADDYAIATEEGITLTNVQISTPAGGKIGTTEIDDYTYSAILNTSGEVAAALIWDGTTAAFTDSSSSDGSSSGNGSSSGGSSGTTSTTVKNPDNSTTTTTTNKKTSVVTETTKQSDGTTATTVTDKNGNMTDISATIPASAAKNGKVVTLPIDAVKPTDSRNAQEIKVDVPSGGATVEIPVKNPTSGTVVVIVGKDGMETVVPGVNVTENGVTVTLTADATIKVIDNSRTFTDVPVDAYFADAVQWAAILYRFAVAQGMDVSVGEDTNILSYHDAFSVTEYAVSAFQWATGAGIVQGNDGYLLPNSNCTRAQIVTFLYRLLGK